MDTASIVSILEDTVYSHTKHIDRCKILIKRFSQTNLPKLEESFSLLAKVSRKLEEILIILNNVVAQSPLSTEDLEIVSAIIFYVYEVSIEEERDLWNRYQTFMPNEKVDEHYTRLDKMRLLARKVLEIVEGTSDL